MDNQQQKPQNNQKLNTEQLLQKYQAEIPGQQAFNQFCIQYDVDYSKVLSQGPSGTVYNWKNKQNPNEDIAVKIIEQDIDQNLQQNLNLGLSSQLILKNIQKPHQNLVQILGIYFWVKQDNQKKCQILIVMKKQQSNLQDLLKSNQIKAEDSLKIGYEIMQALKHLQKQKLNHQNIKPSNIFRGTDGHFKLSDLGQQYGSNLEQNVDNLDLTFVSPEIKQYLLRENQFLNDAEEQKFHEEGFQYDPVKSDVFSLGLVMLAAKLQQVPPYQLIQNLNQRKNNDGAISLQNILQQNAELLDQNFKDLITGMLQDNIKQRFDLEQCLYFIETKILNLNEVPKINITQKGDYYRIQVQTPEGTNRFPSDIVCILDVSGSMAEEAQVKNDQGQKEKYGLSVLDVLKHAVKTIISSLDEEDKFSLVTYSDDARLDYPMNKMTQENKNVALIVTEHLIDEGNTNMWAGLQMGLNVLLEAQKQDPNRHQSILFMTDGDPNVFPPQGFIPTLQKFQAKNKGFNPQINTYAIGKKINSELLNEYAKEGNGQYSFIPCPGFVGTIFVHSIANILTTYATECEILVKTQNQAKIDSIPGGLPSSGNKVQLGDLKFGQSRDIIVKLKFPQQQQQDKQYLTAQISYFDYKMKQRTIIKHENAQNNNSEFDPFINFHIARYLFVDLVNLALNQMSGNNEDQARQTIKGLENQIRDLKVELEDKINDLNGDDANEEKIIQYEEALKLTKAILKDVEKEITLGFSKAPSFHHWGKHYAPSISHAHLKQQCNNFADPGVQSYGGKLFNELKDTIDEIFVKLPPPKPSKKLQQQQPQQLQQHQIVNQQSQQNQNNKKKKQQQHAKPQQKVVQQQQQVQQQQEEDEEPQINMAAFNNCNGGGCFEGNCCVLMQDNNRKKVKDIRKGDYVQGMNGQSNKVLAIVKIKSQSSQIEMVQIEGGLLITPKHPIMINGQWVKPCEIVNPQKINCFEVFNFVLENGHTVNINGINCVTLGHQLKDEKAYHPYFGSSIVIQDLEKCSSYARGFVEIDMNQFVRSEINNQVSGLLII